MLENHLEQKTAVPLLHPVDCWNAPLWKYDIVGCVDQPTSYTKKKKISNQLEASKHRFLFESCDCGLCASSSMPYAHRDMRRPMLRRLHVVMSHRLPHSLKNKQPSVHFLALRWLGLSKTSNVSSSMYPPFSRKSRNPGRFDMRGLLERKEGLAFFVKCTLRKVNMHSLARLAATQIASRILHPHFIDLTSSVLFACIWVDFLGFYLQESFPAIQTWQRARSPHQWTSVNFHLDGHDLHLHFWREILLGLKSRVPSGKETCSPARPTVLNKSSLIFELFFF